MFNKNYNKHEFVGRRSIAEYFYICVKCNIKMWYSEMGNYNLYGLENGCKNLTCDEIIIKGIIE